MMKIKLPYILILIGILPVLHGCSVRNSYQSVKVSPESYFRDGNLQTATIADIPWRVYFNDPVLVSLIEEGIEENLDLESAVSAIRQAEATLAATRAAFFPQVSLAAQATHTRTSNGTDGKKVLGYTANDYTLAAAVSWEADIWGRLSRQNRAQYAAYLASVEYANLVTTSLIANIANSYYSLLALDRQLEITRNTAGVLAQTVRTMEALMKAGEQTGAAVQQSLAAYYSAVVTIPDLEASIRQTENSLSVLLGRMPGAIERSSIDLQQADTTFAHGLPMLSLARRPDVAQAEQQFRQEWELAGAARAAMYPSLTLGSGTSSGSSIGFSATTLSGFFKPENLIVNLIGGLAQPVFAVRQLRSAYEAARESQTQALLNFESTVLQAAEEVSNILYSYRSSLDKNPTREKQIEALQTAVYYTEQLLKAGEATYTEVLTAKQDLLSAQLNQVSDRLEQLQYSVTLYRALGGGVE